jgi:hypothetical protein
MRIATALVAVLSIFALSAAGGDAQAHGKKYSKKYGKTPGQYSRSVKPQVRGYVNRGYSYGYAFKRPTSEGLYGGRNFNNDQTFWERVNSDPGSNTLSASGL